MNLAVAENDPAYRLDEVVVTAERRERNLSRVPLSITALPSEELEASSLINTFDLQNRVPGLKIKTNSRLGQPYLRGVGSDLITVGADPAVATFVDGVYQTRAVAALQDLFDVERVEVLKGPQGTLFGRNTTGGAIHVISKEPTPDLGLQADISYGNFNALRLSAMSNVPLIADRLFLRLSGLANRRDGYSDNLFLDTDQDDERAWAMRGQALLYAADHVEILLGGDFARGRDTRHVSPHPNPDCCANLGIALGGQVPDDPRQVTNNIDNAQEVDAWGLRARLTWELGVTPLLGRPTLTSLTAYRVTDASGNLDLDATDVDAVANRPTETSKTFTQEIQLASETGTPLEWVIGFYTLWEDTSQALNVSIPPFHFLNQPRGKVETHAWAAFGQAAYWLSKRWRLTAGLRYSVDTKRLSFTQTLADPSGRLTGTPGMTTLEDEDQQTWDAVTPKFGLEYAASEHLLIYASATRGFKSGGFNTTQFQAPFEPEFIWAYELGVKASLFEHRTRLSIAGFYYDYDDVQLLALPAGAPPGTFPTIINAAKATVKGIDMEIAARPVAGLAIDLNLLFLDARFDDFVVIDPNNPGDNPDRSNQRMPQAPELTTFIGMQYSWPVWHYGLLTARGEYRYQSAVFFNAFQDPFVKQEGYGLVNARLQFDSADGRWYVALFGHNLTDELYAQNIIRQEPLTGALRFWGSPRTYGGQVGYRF